jgi:uncharacterized protein
MNVDLTSVSGSASYEFDIPAEEIGLDTPGVRLSGPVHFSCEIDKHLIETEITGRIKADAEVDCTRCLQPAPAKMDIKFDVSFVEPDAFPADKELELKDEDLDRDVLQSETIDLKEIAREQILLNLPERVFCKEDCKGLCPKCGTNLNTAACHCSDDEIDPRWAALKNLK